MFGNRQYDISYNPHLYHCLGRDAVTAYFMQFNKEGFPCADWGERERAPARKKLHVPYVPVLVLITLKSLPALILRVELHLLIEKLFVNKHRPCPHHAGAQLLICGKFTRIPPAVV